MPLSRFTTAGITTVVGLLGTDDVARGPGELLATLYALREEGLNAYGYAGGYHVPPATLTGSVRGDLVFVEALIGIGEVAISDHRSSQPTLDELLRIASECHVAGVMTGKAGVLHLHLGDGARGLELVREALRTSELPAARVQSDAREPTPRAVRRGAGPGAARLAPSTSRRFRSRRAKTRTPRPKRSNATLPRARPPIASPSAPTPAVACRVSTQTVASRTWTSAPPAHCSKRCAKRWRAAWRSKLRCRRSPSNPAKLLRLARKGTLAIGHDADLVVLDEQTRADTVVVRGEIHVMDRTCVRRGTFE